MVWFKYITVIQGTNSNYRKHSITSLGMWISIVNINGIWTQRWIHWSCINVLIVKIYGIKVKPATMWNPQATSMVECVYELIEDILLINNHLYSNNCWWESYWQKNFPYKLHIILPQNLNQDIWFSVVTWYYQWLMPPIERKFMTINKY